MTAHDPDPRYSLANERTFLAWVRTALGLLAAAAGLVAVDVPWPPLLVHALGALLALAGGGAAVLASLRWRRVEAAIRAGAPAPPPRAHELLSLVVVVTALAVAALIAFR